jgi:hypothetical protein
VDVEANAGQATDDHHEGLTEKEWLKNERVLCIFTAPKKRTSRRCLHWRFYRKNARKVTKTALALATLSDVTQSE